MLIRVGYTVVDKNNKLTTLHTFCDEVSESTLMDFDELFPGDAPHQIVPVLIEVESINEPQANHHS
jgi:hypothetical protein